jgi:hypothetical protein
LSIDSKKALTVRVLHQARKRNGKKELHSIPTLIKKRDLGVFGPIDKT